MTRLMIALLLACTALSVAAQEAAPTYDEQDRLLVGALASLAANATAACQSLDVVKQYTAFRDKVISHVEEAYPGHTVDLETGDLVPKTAVE